ncbi:hypothetical protein C8R45DRAFT_1076684 [Mycena sanguinolenta]|nr:hypothetical protein C8R45DRAFT_1076684 [Mycena sanguinolenta]
MKLNIPDLDLSFILDGKPAIFRHCYFVVSTDARGNRMTHSGGSLERQGEKLKVLEWWPRQSGVTDSKQTREDGSIIDIFNKWMKRPETTWICSKVAREEFQYDREDNFMLSFAESPIAHGKQISPPQRRTSKSPDDGNTER